MGELKLLEEMLEKAVETETITSSQSRYFLLKYKQGELSLLQIQQKVASSSKTLTKKRDYPVVYEKYVLKKCLGRGGMGEVYEVYNRETWGKFALKKIKSAYLQGTDAQERGRKRFMRECSLQARLEHPNIVKVYDYGTYGKEIFLVTQLVEGETLHELIEREKENKQRYYEAILPVLLDQMVKICEAVYYAHQNGIVHRDINPSNIMIDSEQVWIMDFGLAKRYDIDMTKLTKSTELVGTPNYMSPEQWNNTKIGPPSDIYSLGATLYYMVTQKAPHPETPVEAAYNIINEIPPKVIADYDIPVPEEIGRVVEQAMAYSLIDRFADAQELGEALEKALLCWHRKSSVFNKIKDFFQGKNA